MNKRLFEDDYFKMIITLKMLIPRTYICKNKKIIIKKKKKKFLE